MGVNVREFFSLASWLATRLTDLVGSSQSLNAVFISYNRINNYANGFRDTSKPGLTVSVYTGNASATLSRILLLSSPNREFRKIGATIMETEAIDGQLVAAKSLVEDGVMDIESSDTLIFAYAGLSAWPESVNSVLSIRYQYPRTKIVIVTCDCDIESKRMRLELLLDAGYVSDVIVTRLCGGEEVMGNIINSIIQAWPSSTRPN